MNYYRITAYHPDEDISVILDSNGRFDALWEFSTFLINKGFKIVEVARDDGFEEGNILKTPSSSPKILLRAIERGTVSRKEEAHQGKCYNKIQVADNYYYIIKWSLIDRTLPSVR